MSKNDVQELDPLSRRKIIERIASGFYTAEQWARMAPALKAVLDQEQDEG